MTTRRSFISLCAAAIAGMHAKLSQAAQPQIPGGTARMFVGFTAGGALDVVARVTVEAMKGYAPAFVVDNRPGAGGRLVLDALKRSPPDGSIMALTPASMIVLYPHIYKKLGYDIADFAPVTPVCSLPFLLTVGPMVPAGVKTVADFAQWCRDHPKQASFGTAAAGSMLQFAGAALSRAAGFEFVHVPYGGPGGIQDLAGGRVAATIYPFGTALPHVKSGLIRALATTGPQRNASLPDVPTIREAGFPTAEALEWWGVFLPARTPAALVDHLNRAIREALQSNEVKNSFEKLSVDAAGMPPADFARLIQADFKRWGPVVQASGFTAQE